MKNIAEYQLKLIREVIEYVLAEEEQENIPRWYSEIKNILEMYDD